MANAYRTTRRVEFRDTDAAGLMHFSAFFTFMEEAEHELLRHVGLSVLTSDDEGPISWPRVAARCDYQSSVRFEDVLDIEVRLARVGQKSVTYEFNFSHAGRAVAAGQITAVCCRFNADGTPRSIPIPPAMAESLKTFSDN
jgi:4-hydroxybenzoyl-CoA thioesterase/acyl-CoA thioester hydrolase